MNKFIEFIISLFTRILQAINVLMFKINKIMIFVRSTELKEE